jgi:hypothetical protein
MPQPAFASPAFSIRAIPQPAWDVDQPALPILTISPVLTGSHLSPACCHTIVARGSLWSTGVASERQLHQEHEPRLRACSVQHERLIKLVEEAIFARTENALSVSEMIATPLLRDLYFRRTGLNILVEVEMEVQNLYFRRTGLDLRVNVEKQSLGQCSLYDRWRAACGLPSR